MKIVSFIWMYQGHKCKPHPPSPYSHLSLWFWSRRKGIHTQIFQIWRKIHWNRKKRKKRRREENIMQNFYKTIRISFPVSRSFFSSSFPFLLSICTSFSLQSFSSFVCRNLCGIKKFFHATYKLAYLKSWFGTKWHYTHVFDY